MNLLASRESDVKRAVKIGQSLVHSANPASPDVPLLRKEVKEISERYTDLKDRLANQLAVLEKIIQNTTTFSQEIRKLELWVSEKSNSTAIQEPISTNAKVVHKRIKQVEVRTDLSYVISHPKDVSHKWVTLASSWPP